MPLDQWLLIIITVGALALLVTERISPGITGLLIIAALSLTNLLGLSLSFGVLASPAVVALACMFVISAGVVRAGAVDRLAQLATAHSRSKPGRAYFAIILAAVVCSAFMNNTPLVLILVPLVLGISKPMGEAPSKLLIPISYASIMGGTCTLIGTSTNLVAAAALFEVSGGTETLGMFDFAPVGVVLAVIGTAVMLLTRRRLLPERASLELLTSDGATMEYMTQVELPEASTWEGRTIADLVRAVSPDDGLRVMQLIRDDIIQSAAPTETLRSGDVLLVKGDPAHIIDLHGVTARETSEHAAVGDSRPRDMGLTLFEVVVTPQSEWIGRRLPSLRLRHRHGASVYAVQRDGGAHLRQALDQLRLRAGDVLLVQGDLQTIRNLRASRNVLVVEGVDRIVPRRQRAWLAVLALGLFVLFAVTGLLEVHLAALISALVIVLGRCLSTREAYAAMGWDVLFLVAGTLALGLAFETTGLAADSAEWIGGLLPGIGPHGMVALVFTTSALLTQVLSNNATAALLTPLAYQLGGTLPGVESPMQLVMAVVFGASCCFLTPMAYQTNLLVYGPGGYRFNDFMRAGAPLVVVYLIVCSVLIPLVY